MGEVLWMLHSRCHQMGSKHAYQLPHLQQALSLSQGFVQKLCYAIGCLSLINICLLHWSSVFWKQWLCFPLLYSKHQAQGLTWRRHSVTTSVWMNERAQVWVLPTTPCGPWPTAFIAGWDQVWVPTVVKTLESVQSFLLHFCSGKNFTSI
jgi:hypothetical protein